MLKFGSNNIGKVLFGSNPIGKAYYGSNLVFQVGGGGGDSYPVMYVLSDVMSSNRSSTASGSYTTTLTPTTDYTIRTVSVTMGGVDITSTAYSNGVVTIQDVTGLVVITAVASLLPAGYTRLEYIMNSNGGYIDTGIYLNQDDHIIADYGLTSTASRDRWLFGAVTSGNARFWANLYGGANMAVYARHGTIVPGSSKPTMGHLEVKNRIWTYPGTTGTVDATNCGTFTTASTIYLFDVPTHAYPATDQKLSRFYVEGKFNGYACISPNNEVGLYDLVSQTFFKSATGSVFVAGPEVPTAYDSRVDYIETSGTQIIATNYVPVIGDSFSAEYMLKAAATTLPMLFSAGNGTTQVYHWPAKESGIDGAYHRFFSSSYAKLSFSPVVDQWYSLTISAEGIATIGQNSATCTPAGELDGDRKELWLFKRRDGQRPFTGRLRSLTIENNGAKKLELIPVRVGQVGYLFDTVTNHFYGNYGLGAFTLGSDV